MITEVHKWQPVEAAYEYETLLLLMSRLGSTTQWKETAILLVEILKSRRSRRNSNKYCP